MRPVWTNAIGILIIAVLTAGVAGEAVGEEPATTKIVLVAGPPSHGYGGHEHYAGCVLLAEALEKNVPQVEAVVTKGWPEDAATFEGAAAVVIFCDGGGRHVARPHLEQLGKLAEAGVGVGCLHYGVEIPKGDDGDKLKGMIGGYFETDWSVNPHWNAKFTEFPDHPVARGVCPFEIDDEWYYHMRFVDEMKDVTPILSAVPPEATRQRPDGAHSNNPTVRARKGMSEHVGWTYERADGGRGFGFTGGHWHWNWAQDDFRKVTLNGIVWIAGLEVPAKGVPSARPTVEQLKLNQDYSQPERFDWDRIQTIIDGWHPK